MRLSPKVYTWLCGLFASESIIFGYDLGVIAGVLSATDFIDTMGSRFSDPNLEGLITSIFRTFAGMFPVAYFADFLGRRKTIQVGALVCMLGGALQTGARSIDMMWAGRFFAGFGVGIKADLAPLYQAEIAHPSIRGRLTTLQQVWGDLKRSLPLQCLTVLFLKSNLCLELAVRSSVFMPLLLLMLLFTAFAASWITYGTSAGLKHTQAEWRIPLGVQIIPAIPLIAFILLLPEPPRWLAEKGRLDEATRTLARLHANGNVDDPFVVSQIEDIKAEIRRSKEIGSASWGELFTIPSNFRRVSLGFILQFSVQMAGVSAIQYYSTTIFTTMGFSATRVLLFQSINSIIALIGEACCVLWVDNTERRLPLIVGNVVSGLSFVVGSILMARWPGTVDNSTRTRAKATALTSSASWLSNFFIAQVTPVAFTHIGWKYYLVFAICGHTNALFVWAFFPLWSNLHYPDYLCSKMDALFTDAPLFIARTSYAKRQDRHLAEEELREGTFVPGDLSERVAYTEEEKGSHEHIQ
ncbi:hypothetical protein GYMLUDRAFT_46366 [Collybiopsis luxurians FD-317 M1]|uniref:Major facilitator superfamily (MFS) profile domain-containing protein n=1 Tax=Collybiopsis luxurians FD-317 M1 TaxID=944289 RepID=A0A0D0BPY0_9AGAR|nr:hypothetical protein GYMLUDRAFT_46366 [Collybiopsis luxurians FD-317 M1]